MYFFLVPAFRQDADGTKTNMMIKVEAYFAEQAGRFTVSYYEEKGIQVFVDYANITEYVELTIC